MPVIRRKWAGFEWHECRRSSTPEVTMASWQRILVPVDFSETSQSAVRQAVDLAASFRSSLILLHVGDRAAADVATEFPLGLEASLLDAERERLLKVLTPAEQAQLHPEFVIVAGSPAHEIVRCADEREVDLIVMGTHGRSGVSHMLIGSVAERVIRSAPCPVLVVRNSGPVTASEVASTPDSVGSTLNA
jgi:nucleotide-binding universal stress UspA family protein